MKKFEHTTYVASSLSCLIAALSLQNSKKTTILYIPYKRDNRKKSRSRDLGSELFIASKIAYACNAEFIVKNFSENWIDHIESNLIIDLNTLAHARVSVNVLKRHNPIVIAFGPEHMSAFYPGIFTLNFKALIQKFVIYKTYFKNIGVESVISYNESSVWYLNIKSHQIKNYKYNQFCNDLVVRLSTLKEFTFLRRIHKILGTDSTQEMHMFLPVPAHYGGNLRDLNQMLNSNKFKNKVGSNFFVIKNHPSDNTKYSQKIRPARNQIFLETEIERTFPVELIGAIKPKMTTIYGSGSTALFSPQKYKKIMYYPSSSYGNLLSKRNTDHLIKRSKVIVWED
jgi:hypothetical protein